MPSVVVRAEFGLGVGFAQSLAASRADDIRIRFGDENPPFPMLQVLGRKVKTPVVFKLVSKIRKDVGLGEPYGKQLIQIRVPEGPMIAGRVERFE